MYTYTCIPTHAHTHTNTCMHTHTHTYSMMVVNIIKPNKVIWLALTWYIMILNICNYSIEMVFVMLSL